MPSQLRHTRGPETRKSKRAKGGPNHGAEGNLWAVWRGNGTRPAEYQRASVLPVRESVGGSAGALDRDGRGGERRVGPSSG